MQIPPKQYFPHSSECGLIEASRSDVCCAPIRSSFRIHPNAASLKRIPVPSGAIGEQLSAFIRMRLIEAICSSAILLALGVFPHSSECGLIEARSRRKPDYPRRLPFRIHPNAASLKLEHAERNRNRSFSFRIHPNAASLKRTY